MVVSLSGAAARARMNGANSFAQLKSSGLYRFDVTGTMPTDKITYQPGTLVIKDANGKVVYSHSPNFRGRGNTTWGAPKKPFKVRTRSRQERPFLYPASRDWALMADFFDESYIRSTVGFEIGRRATGRWHPRSVHGVLYWNGGVRGLYRFSETADVQYGRVNIREMKSSDIAGNELTGPYSVEIDSAFVDPGFRTSRNTPVLYDVPSVVGVSAQVAYIANTFETFETALVSGSDEAAILSMVDIPSWVDWYLLMELCCVMDAHFHKSVKFWKDQDAPNGTGKFVFGAPWDLDRSLGNHGGVVTGWRVRSTPAEGYPNWWMYIWDKSPAFRAAARARWDSAFVPVINNIDPFIDSVTAITEPAVSSDRIQWFTAPRLTIDTPAGVKDFLHSRAAWITANL